MMATRTALALLIVSLTACIRPVPHSAPKPVQVSEKMADLAYFAGHWSATMEDPRNGERATLTYRVEPVLSGLWLAGYGHSPELNLTVRDMWGRDPVSGEIFRSVFDSQGVHGMIRSAGWKGDVLVLEGEARTPQGEVKVRETITRIDASSFRAVWEMRTGDAWVTYSIEQVTRVKSPDGVVSAAGAR